MHAFRDLLLQHDDGAGDVRAGACPGGSRVSPSATIARKPGTAAQRNTERICAALAARAPFAPSHERRPNASSVPAAAPA